MIQSLDIMGVKYTVSEVECVDKFEPRLGEINYFTNEIRIDKALPEDMKRLVLTHEMLHGVFNLLGYDALRDDEAKVQGIATALHQIFTLQDVYELNKTT